jgi:hypothetical protein
MVVQRADTFLVNIAYSGQKPRSTDISIPEAGPFSTQKKSK